MREIELTHSKYFLIFVFALSILFNLINFEIFLSSGNALNLICFFLIASIGVSHGSLDNFKGRKLFNIYKIKNFIFFYMSYILISILTIVIWINFPNLTLLIFLIVAAYHFGKEDGINALINFPAKNFLYFLRGSIIILAPLVLHTDETIQIFNFLSGPKSAETIYLLKELKVFEIYLFLSVIICHFVFTKSSFSYNLDALSIIALNYCFEPFLAFTIYFCFLHSIRHILSLSSELNKKSIKKGLCLFLGKSIPLTIITALIFIVSLIFLNSLNEFDEAIYKVIFIGLASLTFPHILLEYLIEKNEK